MLSHASARMLSRTILQGTSRRIVGLSTAAMTTQTTRTTTRIATARVIVPHHPGGSSTRTTRRWMTEQATKETTAASAEKAAVETKKKTSWWSDAKFWGGLGALAGWGMSASAIYDAFMQGPEVISLTMTPVLIVYSTLFARWAYVVTPPNPLLMWCHVANVAAQVNQFRRALQYKMENGQEEQVKEIVTKIGAGAAGTALAVVAGPTARKALAGAGLGVISTIAAADAGPFTVHFWAPMSKWFISGASFMELYRPTDQISLPQYTALTLTGFFFSRYALLVTPINYTLCSVNIALFGSSAWHLGRKIKADFIDDAEDVKKKKSDEKKPATSD